MEEKQQDIEIKTSDENIVLNSSEKNNIVIDNNKGLKGFKLFCVLLFDAILFLLIGILVTTYYTQGELMPKPVDLFKLNKAKIEADIIARNIDNHNQKKEALKNILLDLKGISNYSSDNLKNEIEEFSKNIENLILREDEIKYLENCKLRVFQIMNNNIEGQEKTNELGKIYIELNGIASKTTNVTQQEIASFCSEILYLGKREFEKHSLALTKKKIELMFDNDLMKTQNYNEILQNIKSEIVAIKKTCEDKEITEENKNELSILEKELTEKLNTYKQLKEEHDLKIPELKKRFDELIKKFNIDEDKLEKRTRYIHKNSPSTSWAKTDLYLYISSSDKYLFLFGKFQYVTTSEWLFAKYVTLYVDGKKYDINDFKYSDWQHDNGFGKIWEYASITITDLYKKIFEEIANSKETTLRFHGSKYYDDYKVNEKNKLAIKETLELYQLLNELKK